jgi:hypothetical protein
VSRLCKVNMPPRVMVASLWLRTRLRRRSPDIAIRSAKQSQIAILDPNDIRIDSSDDSLLAATS